MEKQASPFFIGILCWEAGTNPRGLAQLESLVGNSTNPASYDVPVRFCRVPGANIKTILEQPDRKILARMIEEARRLVDDGARAITTSCGFNAIFQKDLADALEVPVFASSLLQVPLISRMLGSGREIGVITAKKSALREEHLHAVGITPQIPIKIFGMEECPEWNKIFRTPDEDVDLELIREEVVGKAIEAASSNPAMGAFVLECTDLPPFSESIRKATGLPVYDFITLVDYVKSGLCNMQD